MPEVSQAPGAHHVVLYDSDAQFLAAALPFARAGLAAREPVFVATGPANTVLLRYHLGEDAGRVVFADARSWYHSPAKTLLAYHDKACAAPGGSRVVGEVVWAGRNEDQAREWTRYEALLNLAMMATGAKHLCPYDTRTLPETVLRAARLTHPGLAAGADYWSNPAYVDPEQFSAACDTAPLPPRPRRAQAYAFHGNEDLAGLREFTLRQARAAGLPATRIDNLMICADEAAANTVRHGAGHGTCWIWTTHTEVLCEISDPKGTLNAALVGYLPPNIVTMDGRGMWIIRQLCDSVDIRTDHRGTRVRLHLDRNTNPTDAKPPA
ncbi:anti-sigma factor RsbA family regulatory protein [Streptomyces sp. CA-132043]|uniref:anti-sigma factor RsbA family regulatory protein n=1 Tax=Streptomyces sp. CA-132043 TaxID=3240048 RepID=UPI003D8F1112